MKSEMDVESPVSENRGKRALELIQNYFNFLNHILIFSVAIYMSFYCYYYGNKPISWHAWLCTIGYQLLMTEAIMAFYVRNLWSQNHTRYTKKTVHWIMQGVGSTGAIVGMIIEFMNKETHFRSTHAKLGLSAGIFTVLGMLNGISALFSVELRTYFRPLYWKFLHNLTGIVAFVLGMVTLYHGYEKGFLRRNSTDEIRMWLKALAIITIVLSLLGALRTFYNQVKTMVSGS